MAARDDSGTSRERIARLSVRWDATPDRSAWPERVRPAGYAGIGRRPAPARSSRTERPLPDVGLRPRNAEAAAKDRLLAHLIEIYVQERANPLFPQVFAKQRDTDKILATVAAMNTGLSHLSHFMEGESYSADRAITTADCALIVYLFFFAECMVRALGQPAIIANHPRIAAYWQAMQGAPAAQRVIGEMRTAIAQSPLKMLVSSPDRTAREQQVTT